MSKLFKRILSAIIAVMMLTAVVVPQNAYAATNNSVFYYQRDSKWGYGRAGYSACYLSSFAMIITNMGHENATPADLYRVNGYSTYTIQSRITSKYGVSWVRNSVYGRSKASKIAMVEELLEKYPQGVIVRNSGHTMIATHVNDNGTIIFNDPAYSNGAQLTMSQTQLGSWSAISYIEVIK